jgi:nucleotide-binding universal stress UspA family protein
MTVQPILCAVDVSNPKEDTKTIQTAAELARLRGAQLDIVAVVPDFGMSSVGGYFDKDHHAKALSEAKAALNKMVTEALDADQNAKVRHVILTGRVYEEVLKLAKADDPSLIVVGGARQADLTDYLLGPNAARIVRHATCSVYVVR